MLSVKQTKSTFKNRGTVARTKHIKNWLYKVKTFELSAARPQPPMDRKGKMTTTNIYKNSWDHEKNISKWKKTCVNKPIAPSQKNRALPGERPRTAIRTIDRSGVPRFQRPANT